MPLLSSSKNSGWALLETILSKLQTWWANTDYWKTSLVVAAVAFLLAYLLPRTGDHAETPAERYKETLGGAVCLGIMWPVVALLSPIWLPLALGSIAYHLCTYKKAQAEKQARLEEEERKRIESQSAAEAHARNLWTRYYSMFDGQHVSEMSGSAFEKFLGTLYSRLGFEASLTPNGADQGVDLILTKDARRIAVQAKRWTRAVGNGAVQEVMAGKTFYRCAEGIVITTSTFSRSAINLADTDPTISLIDGRDLALLCQQFQSGSIPEFSWEEWAKIEVVATRFA